MSPLPAPLTRLDIHRLDQLPTGLLETPARELYRRFDGPLLLHLPGRQQPELFVSVLLHGNEDVGWAAVQQVLREALAHGRQELPRALTVLVGNISAARHGLRRLDGQPDYNRIWPGADPAACDGPEPRWMHAVHALMLQRAGPQGLFAAVDIHNNTGLNPHYAIVNRLDPASLHLAGLFSRIAVLFKGVPGTQTAAFAPHAPALAVECGKPGVAANEAAAARFLTACLHLAAFPDHGPHEGDLDLYHTVAQVKVRDTLRFRFAAQESWPHAPARSATFEPPERAGSPGDVQEADLLLDDRLDHLNFRELPAGALFGRSRHPQPLSARDERGADVSDACFRVRDGRLELARALMPAMLTLDERVVRQDCLCYLMERLPPHRWPSGCGPESSSTRSRG